MTTTPLMSSTTLVTSQWRPHAGEAMREATDLLDEQRAGFSHMAGAESGRQHRKIMCRVTQLTSHIERDEAGEHQATLLAVLEAVSIRD